jgi:hypothetical protein
LVVRGSGEEWNQWQHVAAVFDDSSGSAVIRLFVDGELVGTGTDSNSFTSDGNEYFVIGNMNEPNTSSPGQIRQFFGSLSEARISSGVRYTTAFTPDGYFSADATTLAHWPLSEGSGTTVEETLGSADGTLVGGGYTEDCQYEDADGDGYAIWEDCDDTDATVWGGSNPCPECTSLEFDGSGDYVEVAHNSDLSFAGSDYTFEWWVLLDGAAGGPVLSKRGSGSGSGYNLATYVDSLIASNGCCSGGNSMYFNTVEYPSYDVDAASGWHHVALTHDAQNTVSTYWLDGIAVGDSTTFSSLGANTQSLWFGRERVNTGVYSELTLGGIQVADAVLYSAPFTPVWPLVSNANTVSLWTMEEGGGSTLSDSSSNAYDGTIHGSASWSTSCPAEDLDGDGYAAWEDCDDTNALIGATCLGSCLEILNAGASTGDGTYWIDPDGSGRFEVYCDMTTDGGGWTHVMNLNGANATNYDSADVFETMSVFGTMSDDNYLNAGFYSVHFTESYLVDEAYNTIVISDTAYGNTSNGTQVTQLLANPGSASSSLWSQGASSGVVVYDGPTNDGRFILGDLRLHWSTASYDTPNLGRAVNSSWSGGNYVLIADSNYGYAGARINNGFPNISTSGVDNRFELFLR